MKCTVKYSFNQEPTKLCVWIYSAIAVILEISNDVLLNLNAWYSVHQRSSAKYCVNYMHELSVCTE